MIFGKLSSTAAICVSKNLRHKRPNRVAGGLSPPTPTPPRMRVRTRRFSLSERFIQSIDSALVSIGENLNAWAEVEQNIRRKLTRVFPYSLLYTIESEYIVSLSWPSCIATKYQAIGASVYRAAHICIQEAHALSGHYWREGIIRFMDVAPAHGWRTP